MEQATPQKSFLARHDFLIRRLHSLSGLVPVGAYLVMHLTVNSTVLLGAGVFQEQVDRIHSLGALLPFAEWIFIFLPLLFHGFVGLWIMQSSQSNAAQYRYRNNIRYTLQRVTGMIAFVFIFYHVLHLHHYGYILNSFLGWLQGWGQFDPHQAAASAAYALHPFYIKLIYLVGMLSTVYHFANGLWTMGITWGLWISPHAQRRADYFALTVGILLSLIGIGALWGLSDSKLASGFKPESRHHATTVETTVETTTVAPTTVAPDSVETTTVAPATPRPSVATTVETTLMPASTIPVPATATTVETTTTSP